MGVGTLYDVLVGGEKSTDALTTIGSFITALKTQQGVNATAVNTLLAHYNIGAITTGFGDGDTQLRGMYQSVTVPYNDSSLKLGDVSKAYEYNTWYQNQYYVFTGNGSRMTITASSTYDVGIAAYLNGALVGQSDNTLSGTESFNFTSQSGAKYVLVVTGYVDQKNVEYAVPLSITSP